MNIRRFTSSTTRQAMALVRAEFGNQAIILRTRSIEGGVEIVAMADEALAGTPGASGGRSGRTPARTADDTSARAGSRPPAWADVRGWQPQPAPAPHGRWSPADRLPARPDPANRAGPSARAEPVNRAAPADRADHGRDRHQRGMPAEPMSTLSFQQFVRDRLSHRDSAEGGATGSRPADAGPDDDGGPRGSMASTGAAVAASPGRNRAGMHPTPDRAGSAASGSTSTPASASASAAGATRGNAGSVASRSGAQRAPVIIDPAEHFETAHALMMPGAPLLPTAATIGRVAGPAPSTEPDASELLLAELRKMRGLMRSQLFSLARSQPDSVAQHLMRHLRGRGFSATLVRRLLEKIPAEANNGRAEAWIRQLMVKVIRLDAPHRRILERGGIHALVGPTGVGKTTTVAKLAARFALRHGTDAVGLVTLDTYRIGAHDQLRTFGRLLGIPVSVAHEAEGLARFMSENANRKLILIDTVGVGQRDERLPELIDSTASPAIRRLLVLNAAAQPETLEDVVRAYRVGARGGLVVSKLDEAVKLGGVVDCLVRHRLPLIGLANGQRVPEDWQEPDPATLVRRAFEARTSSVFDFDDVEAASDDDETAAGHA